MSTDGLQLAIGLDVASYSGSDAPAFWSKLVPDVGEIAEFITLEDGFAKPARDGLDAIILANWLAPRSGKLAIIAGAPVSFLEPFHVSTAIATLDYVSEGKAGLLVQQFQGARALDALQAIGSPKGFPDNDVTALQDDTRDAVDVIRRLWDSWEDDAVIRDKQSHRFLDGSKLHYVAFKGPRFNVLGPSITPRPPQGQPIVAATHRHGEALSRTSFADVVFLEGENYSVESFEQGKAPLFIADIPVTIGSVSEIVERIRTLSATGIFGIRLILDNPERQISSVLEDLVPALKSASLIRPPLEGSLRDRFGLTVATNRYGTAA